MSEVDVIGTFISLFANRTDSVFLQQEPVGGKCGYARANRPFDRTAAMAHIAANITMSAPALSERDTARWLAWDSDADKGTLVRVYQYLLEHGFSPIREGAREGREGHLWLLLDEPIPGRVATAFGQFIAEKTRTTINSKDADLEFFPKQSATKNLAGGLRLPLGYNRKPDAQCRGWFHGVKKDVTCQLEWLARQPVNSSHRVLELGHAWWTTRPESTSAHRSVGSAKTFGKPHSDGTLKRVNALQYIPAHQRTLHSDGNWRAGCPACIVAGHDKSRDNLSINAGDPTKWRCWRGCTAAEILAYIGK